MWLHRGTDGEGPNCNGKSWEVLGRRGRGEAQWWTVFFPFLESIGFMGSEARTRHRTGLDYLYIYIFFQKIIYS